MRTLTSLAGSRSRALLAALAPLLLAPCAASAAPTPPGEVRVRVMDEAGKPVPGAEVLFVRFGMEEQAETKLTPNAAGEYAVIPGQYGGILYALAPGYAPAAAHPTLDAATVTLTLRPPRELSGSVLGPDGKPAAGVQVRLSTLPAAPPDERMGGEYRLPLPPSFADRFSAVTDAAGAYHLKGVPQGTVDCEFTDPRFVSVYQHVAAESPTVRMQPGCRIHGRVAGHNPALKRWRAWTTSRQSRGASMAPVNPDGTFLLSGFPPGRYPVIILSSPQDPLVVPAATVTVTQEKPDADVEMRASPGGVILGRAVDAETHAPLAGVPISYIGLHRPENVMGAVVQSGPDGSFRIRMPAGKGSLSLQRWEFQERPKPVEVTVEEGRETPVDVPVRDWLTLSVAVVNGAGKAVPRASVTLQIGESYPGTLHCDAEGKLRVPGVPRKELRLGARSGAEGTAQPLVVKPPFPAEVRLVIGPIPQVTLVGRVVDEAGRPVPGCVVQFWREHSMAVRDRATTDAEGRYRFVVNDLTARFTVRAASGDALVLSGGEPMGDQGAERRFTDLVLTSSNGSVAGRVVDAGGQPVAGITVFWPSGTEKHRAITDADGRFRLTGLPERAVALVAMGPAGTAFVRAQPGAEVAIPLEGER